jgi:hypothetical protein
MYVQWQGMPIVETQHEMPVTVLPNFKNEQLLFVGLHAVQDML